jgi:putative transcriptional regulator
MAVKNDLKKLRKEQHLKQADLATAVGMCERNISNIELEKNPASLETILRLAAYFKVSVEDIFHLEGEHAT